MPLLANVNKWAGFTGFLMLSVHTMQAATEAKWNLWVCTEFPRDAGANLRKVTLACGLTFLGADCCSLDKVRVLFAKSEERRAQDVALVGGCVQKRSRLRLQREHRITLVPGPLGDPLDPGPNP